MLCISMASSWIQKTNLAWHASKQIISAANYKSTARKVRTKLNESVYERIAYLDPNTGQLRLISNKKVYIVGILCQRDGVVVLIQMHAADNNTNTLLQRYP